MPPYSSEVRLFLHAKCLETNQNCIIILLMNLHTHVSTAVKEASVVLYTVNNRVGALKLICNFLSSSSKMSS